MPRVVLIVAAKESSMPTRIVCLFTFAVAFAVGANAFAAEQSWTLATADTELKLAVVNDVPQITSIRTVSQTHNWISSPAAVPMPALANVPPLHWTFQDATDDHTAGETVTLRFTCDIPALELRSVWRAAPGPGPVENWVIVENKSPAAVTFAPTAAALLPLSSDATLITHFADKTQAGKGVVHEQELGPKSTLDTNRDQIPLLILNAKNTHGLYLGFEWELGGFHLTTADDSLRPTVALRPLTDSVTRNPGTAFLIPSVYYGAYSGDIDDGSNSFKRWFWTYKITRSLHDHADEPWVEVCMQDIGGTGASSITGNTPQSAYNRLAATGAECAKMDFWDGTGGGWYTDRDWQFHPAAWPNGFDFAAKTHKAGMKASLYMGGTYKDADLSTPTGRDAELSALLQRFDAGWFDIWRTDRYTRPTIPSPIPTKASPTSSPSRMRSSLTPPTTATKTAATAADTKASPSPAE
jgi:hypothetical protein